MVTQYNIYNDTIPFHMISYNDLTCLPCYQIYEKTIVYDGDDTDVDGCKIKNTNEGAECSVGYSYLD